MLSTPPPQADFVSTYALLSRQCGQLFLHCVGGVIEYSGFNYMLETAHSLSILILHVDFTRKLVHQTLQTRLGNSMKCYELQLALKFKVHLVILAHVLNKYYIIPFTYHAPNKEYALISQVRL